VGATHTQTTFLAAMRPPIRLIPNLINEFQLQLTLGPHFSAGWQMGLRSFRSVGGGGGALIHSPQHLIPPSEAHTTRKRIIVQTSVRRIHSRGLQHAFWVAPSGSLLHTFTQQSLASVLRSGVPQQVDA